MPSLCDVFDHKLPPVELYGLAGPCSFDCLENRGHCGNPHDLSTIACELAGGDGNDEVSTSKPHKRSFSDGRLWPEVDLSQLVQLIGMIVEGIVQRFGKITGDFRLGLLIAFDRFASVEPSICNIIEVLFAGAFKGRALKRKHCLFDDVLVHRYLLEEPRSSQWVWPLKLPEHRLRAPEHLIRYRERPRPDMEFGSVAHPGVCL